MVWEVSSACYGSGIPSLKLCYLVVPNPTPEESGLYALSQVIVFRTDLPPQDFPTGASSNP